MRRLIAAVWDWLLASNQMPEWALRCQLRGCDGPAEPILMIDDRIWFLCRDCQGHLEHRIADVPAPTRRTP